MYHHLPMFILRASATISSVFMYLSPLGMIRSITASKTTEPHSFWPILAALGNSTIWSAYGLLSYDIFPLFVTNFIGALLNFYYCRVFFQYEKKRILFLIASFILFSALVVTIWETVSDEEDEDALARLGFIGCIVCVLMVSIKSRLSIPLSFVEDCTSALVQNLFFPWQKALLTLSLQFAAPLSTIFTVLRTKSTKSLPRAIIFANVLTSGLWTTYGVIKHNKYIYGPNGTGLILGIAQVYLYHKFSSRSDNDRENQKRQASLRRLSNPFQKYSFIDDVEDDDYRKILRV